MGFPLSIMSIVPGSRFALLNNHTNEPLDPEGYYMKFLEMPNSNNGFKGKAVYCDARENTQDHISFTVSSDGKYYEAWKHNEYVKFLLFKDGERVVGFSATYANDAFIANFILETELYEEELDLLTVVEFAELEIVSF